MKIAITGFGPFGHDTYNPTESVLKALHAADPELRVQVFPVSVDSVDQQLAPFLKAHQPEVVISLGLAGGRTALAAEMIALNRMDFGIPDVSGAQWRNQPITPEGPTALSSLLDVETICALWREHEIPGYVSYSAGTYLCNYLYYRVLQWCQTSSARATFIHVPYSTVFVPRPEKNASMDELRMVQGIQCIVEAVRQKRL